MTVVSMNYLLEAGVHFGHQKRRWNPKMKEYIYTSRDDIYIIDLQKTEQKLEEAYAAMKEIAENEGTFLFVGTKKQASEAVEEAATRTNSFFVNERWLGGTLTNFKTIRSRIKRMDEIEEMEANGRFDLLPNKEVILLKKEYDKLYKNLRGIRTMAKLPDCLVIVDPKKEEIAIREAHRLGIPVVGLVDTNCDPEAVDYVIPGNDDAVRSVKLLIGVLANAIAEVNNLEVVDYITEDDKTKKEVLGEEGELSPEEEIKEAVKKAPKKEKKEKVEEPKEVKEEAKEEVKEEKVEKKTPKKAAPKKDTKKEEKEDFSKLTVADLKAKAKEAGISGYSTMKKAELVKALSK